MDILSKISHELRIEIPCRACGTPFPATHPARQYCSSRCYRRAARERTRLRDLTEAIARRNKELIPAEEGILERISRELREEANTEAELKKTIPDLEDL